MFTETRQFNELSFQELYQIGCISKRESSGQLQQVVG